MVQRPPRWASRARPSLHDRWIQAVAQHRAGALQDAETSYRRLLAERPQWAEVLGMLGLLHLQQGRDDTAIALLEQSLGLEARPVTLANYGTALRRIGRLDDAQRAFEAALDLDPENPQAHCNLGNVLRERGRTTEAARAYEAALELDPSLFAAAANLARISAHAFDLPLASLLGHYRRATTIADAQGLTGADVAQCFNAIGMLLRATGEPQAAIVAHRRALVMVPDDPTPRIHISTNLRILGADADAIDELKEIIAAHPEHRAAYPALATALRVTGREREATEVYRAWHAIDPEDPIAAHMASREDGEPPERASDHYIRQEFDAFASGFDQLLLQRLEYRVPELVSAGVQAALRGASVPVLLDAGCGTGLCGPWLRASAMRLEGLDLSPKMLEVARERGCYDALIEGELTSTLLGRPDAFDAIAAADVLCYFGRLEPVFAAIARALRPGAPVVFSVESADPARAPRGYAIHLGGRYEHTEPYVRAALSEAGLAVEGVESTHGRHEAGRPVPCLVVSARRPSRHPPIGCEPA